VRHISRARGPELDAACSCYLEMVNVAHTKRWAEHGAGRTAPSRSRGRAQVGPFAGAWPSDVLHLTRTLSRKEELGRSTSAWRPFTHAGKPFIEPNVRTRPDRYRESQEVRLKFRSLMLAITVGACVYGRPWRLAGREATSILRGLREAQHALARWRYARGPKRGFGE
jgi:hypothetical protein